MFYKDLRARIDRKMKRETLRAVTDYVTGKKPALWGQDRPRAFLAKSIAIAIYKDIRGIGYGALSQKIKAWYSLTPKSLAHNQKVRIFNL